MSNHWVKPFEGASLRRLQEDDTLFLRDDVVQYAYLVREGRIHLRRALRDGGLLTLHTAIAGDLVAEASLFADQYHCDAVSEAQTTIAVLPRATLLAYMKSLPSNSAIAIGAFERSVRELQTLRTRIEVMRLKKVADRLDAYLELFGPPKKGAWVQVADWIGVTPPALYRELARRRT
ncbi:MAG: Crp/Fnr family transcriptional regulator [Pseudomonadota bacterium]